MRSSAAITVLLLGALAPSIRAADVATREVPNSVLGVVARAASLGSPDPAAAMRVTVSLRFRDPAGAQSYADAVSSPSSPLYRAYLTPKEIAERFGPTPAQFQAVTDYLRSKGLRTGDQPENRMTVQATGTVARVERAFGTKIRLFREAVEDAARRDGPRAQQREFQANATPVKLPTAIAGLVEAVSGLENYTKPKPLLKRSSLRRAVVPITPAQFRTAFDLGPIYNAPTSDLGQGRTIAIPTFDLYESASMSDFITTFAVPVPAGGAMSNISMVNVDGGYAGALAMGEADLDSQMTIGQAPLSNVIIYDAPATSIQNEIDVLAAIVNANAADICSESYAWESGTAGGDATPATLAAAHAQHLMMTMQGITYLAASGDTGSSFGEYIYPASDPEALDVGGTTLQLTGANLISSEVAWSGSGGGYSVSAGFANPAYQVGRGVPTDIAYRMIPDIAAPGGGSSELSGPFDFYYLGVELAAEGTSNASPITCAGLALVEQYLIDGDYLKADASGHYRLGRLNDAIYALNGRSDVFYDITSGSNQTSTMFPNGFSCTPYYDLVTGWGSLDFYNLAAALTGPLTVTVKPSTATIMAGQTQQLMATVTGSNVTGVAWSIQSGPGSVNSSGLYTAPATVGSPQTAVVQATSVIDSSPVVSGTATITIDPISTNVSVSGAVTLIGSLNEAQQITFTLRPSGGGSDIVQNVTLSGAGAYTLTNVPTGTYTVAIKGGRWLRADVDNVVATSDIANVNASLIPGDINGDNTIDLNDFSLLVQTYGLSAGEAGYNANADLNCDGQIDLNDFSLLAEFYGETGDP